MDDYGFDREDATDVDILQQRIELLSSQFSELSQLLYDTLDIITAQQDRIEALEVRLGNHK